MVPLRRAGFWLALATSLAWADGTARIVVQRSPLAGFQYYSGKALWDEMKVGDRLSLTRERDNRHDGNAIRVEWRGHKIGYVPRGENVHLARQMDLGASAEARITALHQHRNGRKRVSYEISVPMRPHRSPPSVILEGESK